MQVAVNEALPEEEQLSWIRRTSLSALCNAYDRLYPNNYLTAVLRSLAFGCFAFGLAILVAEFLLGGKF